MAGDAAPGGRTMLRIVLVGLAAGFLSGLFGVGGGVLMVPALVLVLGMGQRLAHGTSLAAIVPIALAGVLGYALGGRGRLGGVAVPGRGLGGAGRPHRHPPAARAAAAGCWRCVFAVVAAGHRGPHGDSATATPPAAAT